MKCLLSLLALVLMALPASANYIMFSPPVTVTVNGTSTKYLNQNNLRTYLLIQNSGSVNVIVKFGSVQSGSEGIVIVPGGNYEPFNAPSNSVYMETASSTASVTIQEGQ